MGLGGGGGTRSDRKNLEFWEAQNLNSQVFFCHSERTWFWRFGRLKISILRAFGLLRGSGRSDRIFMGGGGARSDRIGALGLPKPQFSGVFFIPMWGGGIRSDRKGGGAPAAVTERTWFWSFGKLKISILRAFCHCHVVGEGGGAPAVTDSVGRGGGGAPVTSLGGGTRSDRKNLVLEL